MKILEFLKNNKVRITAILGAVITNLHFLGVPENVVSFFGAVLAVVAVGSVGHVMSKDKY